MGLLEKETVTRVIASSRDWIAINAIQQLEQTWQLKGSTRVVSMSDMPAGKGCPIDAACLLQGWRWR